jgi:hypothetical protein
MDNDFEIFEGKSFKDLCKDIYINQVNRKDQIELLVGELKSKVHTVADAMIIVPMIKDYLVAANQNDEHLLKLAQVIQRLMTAQTQAAAESGVGLLTEEEKKKLTELAEIEIKALQDSASIIVAQIQKE